MPIRLSKKQFIKDRYFIIERGSVAAQKRNKTRIAASKIRLAFKKRHREYKTFFKQLEDHLKNDENVYFTDFARNILYSEIKFSECADHELNFANTEGILFDVLKPDKDIEEDNHQYDWLFYPLFYNPGICPIDKKFNLQVDPSDIKNIEDYEELIKIDLRRNSSQLIDEFTEFIESRQQLRKDAKKYNKLGIEAIVTPESFQPGLFHYSLKIKGKPWEESWAINVSRYREEAWNQLKIWDLWKDGQGFKRITKELTIQGLVVTVDSAKQSFHKAYERIYGKPYNPIDVWKNENRIIPRPDIEKFKSDCPNKPCDTCKTPCPEFEEFIELYINQDCSSQKEKLVFQSNPAAKVL